VIGDVQRSGRFGGGQVKPLIGVADGEGTRPPTGCVDPSPERAFGAERGEQMTVQSLLPSLQATPPPGTRCARLASGGSRLFTRIGKIISFKIENKLAYSVK
jgi:hypothetical protein